MIAYVQGNQPVLAVRRFKPYRHGVPSDRSFGGVPGRSPVQTRSLVRIVRYADPPRPSLLLSGCLLVSGSSRQIHSRSARGSCGMFGSRAASAGSVVPLRGGRVLSVLRVWFAAVAIAFVAGVTSLPLEPCFCAHGVQDVHRFQTLHHVNPYSGIEERDPPLTGIVLFFF